MKLRTFELERYFGEHEFTTPHLLCASDCEPLTLGQLLSYGDVPLAALGELSLGYSESQGTWKLRSAIASEHRDLTPEQVVVTCAPIEGIFIAMVALLGPGDEVVVQTPCYQSLLEVARWRGCEVRAWPMRDDDEGWHLDWDHLERVLSARTQMVVVNFPHNPTGYLPAPGELERLVERVAQTGAWLFSDEMYRGLEYDPTHRLISASDLYPRAITLSGLSKVYGLAGVRTGWLCARSEHARRAFMGVKDYTTICAPGPCEFLAHIAVLNRDAIAARHVSRITRNLDALRALIARWPEVFEWREPQAGTVTFVRLCEGVSAEDFCRRARASRGLLCAPAGLFDFGDSHVRWGLGREGFVDSLALVEAFLSDEPPSMVMG